MCWKIQVIRMDVNSPKSRKAGNERLDCTTLDIKKDGRCHTPQNSPEIRLATSGLNCRSKRGRAYPRQPSSSHKGPVYIRFSKIEIANAGVEST